MAQNRVSLLRIDSEEFENMVHLIHLKGMASNPRSICLKHNVLL